MNCDFIAGVTMRGQLIVQMTDWIGERG